MINGFDILPYPKMYLNYYFIYSSTVTLQVGGNTEYRIDDNGEGLSSAMLPTFFPPNS